MNINKLPENFKFLPEMYNDEYYPCFLVDKLVKIIKGLVTYIETTSRIEQEIQTELDRIVLKINELQEDFQENDSEIETVARESIAMTIENILKHYQIDIEVEEAIREREW